MTRKAGEPSGVTDKRIIAVIRNSQRATTKGISVRALGRKLGVSHAAAYFRLQRLIREGLVVEADGGGYAIKEVG